MHDDAARTIQLAVANTLLMWFRTIELLSGFDRTAKYVGMFLAVTRDMASFLIMIAIFVISNGFALDLLYPNHLHNIGANSNASASPAANELARWKVNISDPIAIEELAGTLPRSMFSSFNMMLGAFETSLLDDAFSPALAYAVFFQYTVLVTIVMLNLLIALMGGSYERVAETAELETLKQRAELILQFERMMTKAEQKDQRLHPTYLHLLVKKDSDAEEGNRADEEAGVINGVKRLLQSKLSMDGSKVGALHNKVGALDDKVDQLQSEVHDLNKQMSEVVTMLKRLQPNDQPRSSENTDAVATREDNRLR
eukprot:COSAG06_NODE_946_length_11363_cov_6.766602_4_plen_312_part_00